jgi:putative membrane protein
MDVLSRRAAKRVRAERRILDEEERRGLERRVAALEEASGAQVVLAVVRRCDSYAELPWKAFALGAAIAGLKAAAAALWWPAWLPGPAALLAVAATLAGGLLAMLACLLLPPFARLLLDAHRAEMETRQYAESMFLARELFATRRRCGLLLLVSLFERRVVLLPDSGLAARLDAAAMRRVIARMGGLLAAGRTGGALAAGLEELESVLAGLGAGGAVENELPDNVIEEHGA